MRIIFSFIILLAILPCTYVYAEDNSYGASLSTSFTILQDQKGNNFYAGTIPNFEYLDSLYENKLYLLSGSQWTWGYSKFFVDWGLLLGVRYYPIEKYVSLYTFGEAGTFFFNNITLAMHFGGDIDFDFGNNSCFFVGAEYYRRKVNGLAEFVEKDHWYLECNGVSFHAGIRTRFTGSPFSERRNPLIL